MDDEGKRGMEVVVRHRGKDIGAQDRGEEHLGENVYNPATIFDFARTALDNICDSSGSFVLACWWKTGRWR